LLQTLKISSFIRHRVSINPDAMHPHPTIGVVQLPLCCLQKIKTPLEALWACASTTSKDSVNTIVMATIKKRLKIKAKK
jgi:hypothetical protein